MGVFLPGGAVGGKKTEYLLGCGTVEAARRDDSVGAGPADFGHGNAIRSAGERPRRVGNKQNSCRPAGAPATPRSHLDEHGLTSRDRRADSHRACRNREGDSIGSGAQGADR